LQDGAIVNKSLCCGRLRRTIKAGPCKLSRKENGKPPPRPGELRLQLAESSDGGNRRSRMSLKTQHFLPLILQSNKFVEI
jgi:hypothetical protein